MKRLTTIFVCALAFCLYAYAQQSNNKPINVMEKKVLVAYFSATGTTEAVAKQIAAITTGDLFKIQSEVPYTDADLNWRDKNSRSSVEMNDRSSRPAISGNVSNISQYDVVFIGFPIWWYTAPTIVNTFIESYNLKGKILIPFATSGSSDIEKSVSDLKKSYPDYDWQDGKLLNRIGESEMKQWLDSL